MVIKRLEYIHNTATVGTACKPDVIPEQLL
jgi:hypothetical protein